MATGGIDPIDGWGLMEGTWNCRDVQSCHPRFSRTIKNPSRVRKTSICSRVTSNWHTLIQRFGRVSGSIPVATVMLIMKETMNFWKFVAWLFEMLIMLDKVPMWCSISAISRSHDPVCLRTLSVSFWRERLRTGLDWRMSSCRTYLLQLSTSLAWGGQIQERLHIELYIRGNGWSRCRWYIRVSLAFQPKNWLFCYLFIAIATWTYSSYSLYYVVAEIQNALSQLLCLCLLF
jgi:hypothetical protein